MIGGMIPAHLAALPLLFLAREDARRGGTAYLAACGPADLRSVAEGLYAAGFHLEDLSGLEVAEGAVVIYHYDHFDQPGRISLLSVAPHSAPGFPSIADIFQGAEWHERETRDFFGFAFFGNPNFIPLLLPDDMAELHPLKKDAESRVPLRVLFDLTLRGSEVLKKDESFVLLDAPVASSAAPAVPGGGL